MSDEQYQILQMFVIQPLIRQNARVYIFGSRASLKHHSHSDVDILYKLVGGASLPPGFLSKIKEDIEESRFPFIVDLVNEEDLAENYRRSVLAGRVELVLPQR